MNNIKEFCVCACAAYWILDPFFFIFSTKFISLTSHIPHEDINFSFAPFSHHWTTTHSLRARTRRKKIYLPHNSIVHSLFSITFCSFLTFLVFFTKTFHHSPFIFSYFLFFTATTREKMTYFSMWTWHDAEIYVKRVKAEPIMNDFFMCVAQLLFSVLPIKKNFLSFSCENCGKYGREEILKIYERNFKIKVMNILWIFHISHEWSCVDFRMNF